MGAEDGIVQNFNVEYSVSGQGPSSLQLSLVRQSDKAMFLFDTWKVSAAGMLVENYPGYSTRRSKSGCRRCRTDRRVCGLK